MLSMRGRKVGDGQPPFRGLRGYAEPIYFLRHSAFSAISTQTTLTTAEG
jgi:hypothetical protein